jgi:antitoxin ParD1/3/4
VPSVLRIRRFHALRADCRVCLPIMLPQTARVRRLAKICQAADDRSMPTMNISLPEALKSFVDKQVASGAYGTSSEYLRELIRRDQGRLQLRGLLLEGAESAPGSPADRAWFAGLRKRVRKGGGARR